MESTAEECFSFFSNLANIGSCIPDCESVSQVDASTAVFKVRLKVGYLSKSFELKARLKDSKPPTHISFVGHGSDAEITGNLDIRSISDTSSEVSYSIEIRPISVTGKTAIAMIGNDLVKKQATQFAGCVKEKLEKYS